MLAEVGRRADFALTPATAVVRVKREAETWSGTTNMWPVICGGPMAPRKSPSDTPTPLCTPISGHGSRRFE